MLEKFENWIGEWGVDIEIVEGELLPNSQV